MKTAALILAASLALAALPATAEQLPWDAPLSDLYNRESPEDVTSAQVRCFGVSWVIMTIAQSYPQQVALYMLTPARAEAVARYYGIQSKGYRTVAEEWEAYYRESLTSALQSRDEPTFRRTIDWLWSEYVTCEAGKVYGIW